MKESIKQSAVALGQLFALMILFLVWGGIAIFSLIFAGDFLSAIMDRQEALSQLLYNEGSLFFLASYQWYHSLDLLFNFIFLFFIAAIMGLAVNFLLKFRPFSLLLLFDPELGEPLRQKLIALRKVIFKVFPIFCVWAVIIAALAVNDYRRFDADGFVVNPFFSLKETRYLWSQVQRVDIRYKFDGVGTPPNRPHRSWSVNLHFIAATNDGESHDFGPVLRHNYVYNESLQNQTLELAKLFCAHGIPVSYTPLSAGKINFLKNKSTGAKMRFAAFEEKLFKVIGSCEH